MNEIELYNPDSDWVPSEEIAKAAGKFLAKISIPENETARLSQCWLWEGKIKKGGHAVFHMSGLEIPIHRYAWLLWVGEVPGKLFARPAVCSSSTACLCIV